MPAVQHTDDMVRQVDTAILDLGRMQPGEYVTIVAGSPPAISGSTNAMRVHKLGNLCPALLHAAAGTTTRRYRSSATLSGVQRR